MAYNLVRKNIDQKTAHECLISICKFGAYLFESKTVVDANCAVAISGGNEQRIRWRVIEDDCPSHVMDEIASDSYLGNQLRGKSIGEMVVLNNDPLNRVEGTIEEIVDKIAYRLKDSLARVAEYFQDSGFLRTFDFSTPGGGFHVDAFWAVQRQLNEPMNRAIQFYRDHPSISLLSKKTNRSILETVYHVTSSPDLHLQCCTGIEEEQRQAACFIDDESREVVLDATCLASLYALHAKEHLLKLPANTVISVSTLDTLRSLRRDRNSRFYAKSFVGIRGGTPFVTERTEEDVQRGLDYLNSFIAWLAENALIVGGRSILAIPTADRERLRGYIGTAMVEAMGVAIDRNAIVISDDLIVSSPAFTRVSVDRLWTSSWLQKLRAAGLLSDAGYRQIVTCMLTCDYRFIPVDKALIGYVGSLTTWNVNRIEMAALIDWIHRSGVINPNEQAIQMIVGAWENSSISTTRTDLLEAVVRSIGKRHDAIERLRELHTRLRPVFQLRPDQLEICQRAIRREEVRGLATSPLILPGDPEYSFPSWAIRRK